MNQNVTPPPHESRYSKLKANQQSLHLLAADINAHFQSGNYDALLNIADICAQLFPKIALGFKAKGVALYFLNEKRSAIKYLRKAFNLDKKDAELLSNLGQCLVEVGGNFEEYKEAHNILKRALLLKANDPVILNNLAGCLIYLEEFKEAENYAKKALIFKNDYVLAKLNLATAQFMQHKRIDAKNILKEITNEKDQDFQFYILKASILDEEGSHEEALENANKALNLKPDNFRAYEMQGKIYRFLNQFFPMIRAFQKSVELSNNHPNQLVFLATSYKDIGLNEKAREVIYSAIKNDKGNYFSVITTLPLILIYSAQETPEHIGKELKKMERFIAKKTQPLFKFQKPKTQPEKLKIGFVSGDFFQHAVSFFIVGLLQELQESNLEFYAYLSREKEDPTSQLLKSLFKEWRSIELLDDNAAANTIHNDDIHILFDLSGHTNFNRLKVFALKPAPIQISWMGFFGSTAYPGMDYFLADYFCVPKNSTIEKQFKEKVLRMPDVWEQYTPAADLLDVSPPPFLKNAFITFGSFVNTNKAGEKSLDLWAKVLKAIPDARFYYFRDSFNEIELKNDYLKRFENLGINPNRIEIVGMKGLKEYAAAFQNVDIILDSFPVSGMTTTAEALYMGVPTISYAGHLMASRLSGSCLNAVGLKEWIVENEEDYVQKAVELNKKIKSNPQFLKDLRFSLREKTLKSPLCDAKLFARNFKTMLWNVWEEYLKNPR